MALRLLKTEVLEHALENNNYPMETSITVKTPNFLFCITLTLAEKTKVQRIAWGSDLIINKKGKLAKILLGSGAFDPSGVWEPEYKERQLEDLLEEFKACRFYLYKNNLSCFDGTDHYAEEERRILVKEHYLKQEKKFQHCLNL